MDFRGEFFDYDPLTGLREQYEDLGDGKVAIHTYQDVAPFLDYAAELRNSRTADDGWQKHGASVYAIIPPILQGMLYKRGINFMDPNHTKAVVDAINKDYPRFKTTDKKHSLKGNDFGK